jgi:hypothetical protein
VSDPHDPGNVPRLPADFSVEDILRVPAAAREPAAPPRVEPDQEARAALWELDFALQELHWFRRKGVDEQPLLQSVARQIAVATAHVGRFPLPALPMPADLSDALADRFARLSDALEDLPPGWSGHEDLVQAHSRLRSALDQRDVDV